MLLDWQTSRQDVDKVREAYGRHNDAERRVLSMRARHTDPKVGVTVRGLERFYPYSLFQEVVGEPGFVNAGIAFNSGGKIVVDPREFEKCKRKLADRLCSKNSRDWFCRLEHVLMDVEDALRAEGG